jgi:hypothetical protein
MKGDVLSERSGDFTSPSLRRLNHDPQPQRARKSLIFCTLYTLENKSPAIHSFSNTCALFGKHRGCWAASSNPTLPILEPPCSRDRLPDRGPFPKNLAPKDQPNSQSPAPNRRSRPNSEPASRPAALSIFTCNKKAIYSKLTRNRKRTESEQRLRDIPSNCIDILQEMDR